LEKNDTKSRHVQDAKGGKPRRKSGWPAVNVGGKSATKKSHLRCGGEKGTLRKKKRRGAVRRQVQQGWMVALEFLGKRSPEKRQTGS